ncbi:TauD/TfdA family dioxygenase [Burkholderia gladioli]|uniref:TauD/TfdA family dioxygenase n=1 Tax=Burkholderia gladioli TaxID=28095 RepID=UPI0016410FED|nr:TauD/TfdA family dioxygenase [Burkholderia gladioli]
MNAPAPLIPDAAALLGADAVQCAPLVEGRLLPLCVTPLAPELASSTEAFTAWYAARRAAVDTLLDAHGAVLWRGFALPDTAAFGRFGALYPAHRQGYTAGAAPRQQIAGQVYESTRMPPPFKIGLHQEMAYMPAFPRLVAFYCRQPAEAGGETPICDMRRVTERLPAPLRERFAERGVMYLRNFAAPGESAADKEVRASSPFGEYHRAWDDAFGTTGRAEVERLCAERDLGWRWLDDGSVTVSHVGPAMRVHPRTGQAVWFNQASAQHPNPRSMNAYSFRYLQRVYGGRAAFPYEIRYGDGEAMPFEDLIAVYDALDREELSFPWQRGDLLLVDNMLVAHGRNPYRGHRDTQVMLFD